MSVTFKKWSVLLEPWANTRVLALRSATFWLILSNVCSSITLILDPLSTSILIGNPLIFTVHFGCDFVIELIFLSNRNCSLQFPIVNQNLIRYNNRQQLRFFTDFVLDLFPLFGVRQTDAKYPVLWHALHVLPFSGHCPFWCWNRPPHLNKFSFVRASLELLTFCFSLNLGTVRRFCIELTSTDFSAFSIYAAFLSAISIDLVSVFYSS